VIQDYPTNLNFPIIQHFRRLALGQSQKP